MPFNRLTAGLAALTSARAATGKPYIFGGTWPSSGGTDCSGLCQFAYGSVGIALARSTYEQYKEFPLGASQMSLPGDLLFIPGSDPGPGGEPGHVMIYVSPGQVFQAAFTGEPINQYPYDTSKFEFRTRPALSLPLPMIPAKPTRFPSVQTLNSHGYVHLIDHASAALAILNGYQLLVWNGIGFSNSVPNEPTGTFQYADKNFRTKKVS
jgi:hypothetical protein